jgi:hypothetical protein
MRSDVPVVLRYVNLTEALLLKTDGKCFKARVKFFRNWDDKRSQQSHFSWGVYERASENRLALWWPACRSGGDSFVPKPTENVLRLGWNSFATETIKEESIPPDRNEPTEGDIAFKTYFKANFKPVQSDEDKLVKEVRDAIFDSVKVHMRSDVPVGSFLSGGIDSSFIVSVSSSDWTGLKFALKYVLNAISPSGRIVNWLPGSTFLYILHLKEKV